MHEAQGSGEQHMNTMATRRERAPVSRLAALASAACLFFAMHDASALALGRVTVVSALGEPLRAEVEVPEITAEEASSLRASIANPDAFRAAGVEYNALLTGASVQLMRRPDGRAYLAIRSDRPVNDPFVDVIVEASWSSGRLVRDFTMLFDPPSMRAAAPQITAPITTGSATAPSRSGAYTPPPLPPISAPRTGSGSGAPRSAKVPRTSAAKAEPLTASGGQIVVKQGDTAGHIARGISGGGASLDQMLVAMLRSNPQAFISGNVNRIKSGAVINVPSGAEAAAIPQTEARKVLAAQSVNFGQFKSSLAQAAPSVDVGGNTRAAGGQVQADVRDAKRPASQPDKLTLSKGAMSASSAAADKLAKDKQSDADAKRKAELNKNLSDLKQIAAASAPGASSLKAGVAGAAAGTAAAVGIAAGKAASAVAPIGALAASAAAAAARSAASSAASAAKTAASATMAGPAAVASAAANAVSAVSAASMAIPASAAAVAASSVASMAKPSASAAASAPANAPAPSPAAPSSELKPLQPKPAVVVPPAPESSFIDGLIENPLVPAGGGLLLAGLGAWSFMRWRKGKQSTQVDSSFLESRLQPDSFFGQSGGQRVDTQDAKNSQSGVGGSSLVYSPSQLDAAGDVDPVAEADVYLAYGRDLQAEEILKEALRVSPQRVAVHAKLLEIYAKRRDARAFEAVAKDMYAATKGEGPEWLAACELGRELEPGNNLYQPGGAPSGGAVAAAAVGSGTIAFGSATIPTSAIPSGKADGDIDLDLDFSMDDGMEEQSGMGPLETPSANGVGNIDMSFGDFEASKAVPLIPVLGAGAVSGGLNFDAPSFKPSAPAPLPTIPMHLPAASPAPAAAKDGMLEFDLGNLSLDLPSASAPVTAQEFEKTGGDDAQFETKLALAQEFKSIGDDDGARSLIQEVLAEAGGAMKARAQRMLNEMS